MFSVSWYLCRRPGCGLAGCAPTALMGRLQKSSTAGNCRSLPAKLHSAERRPAFVHACAPSSCAPSPGSARSSALEYQRLAPGCTSAASKHHTWMGGTARAVCLSTPAFKKQRCCFPAQVVDKTFSTQLQPAAGHKSVLSSKALSAARLQVLPCCFTLRRKIMAPPARLPSLRSQPAPAPPTAPRCSEKLPQHFLLAASTMNGKDGQQTAHVSHGPGFGLALVAQRGRPTCA